MNRKGFRVVPVQRNRLQSFRRGTLSSSGNNVNGGGTSLYDKVVTLNTNADSSQSYTLDVIGNQTAVKTDGTTVTNTINSDNQKTAIGANSITFDNNGNALTGVGGTISLTYDAWGDEITSATCTTSRTYDALGRMAVISTPDYNGGAYVADKQHDLYYSNKWQELQDNATWTTAGCGCCCCCCTTHTDAEQYVWGKGYVDDLVLRDRTPDGGSTARLYVQQDANFNVTAITDTSGAVQERLVYTPYGTETTLTSAWATGPTSFGQFNSDSFKWIYGFQGWRYDTGTAFYTVRNRDYEVVFGWVGADPTGGQYIDGMNLYQVERSSPARFTDPLGLSVIYTYGPPPILPASGLPPDYNSPPLAKTPPPATQGAIPCPEPSKAGPTSAILPDVPRPNDQPPSPLVDKMPPELTQVQKDQIAWDDLWNRVNQFLDDEAEATAATRPWLAPLPEPDPGAGIPWPYIPPDPFSWMDSDPGFWLTYPTH